MPRQLLRVRTTNGLHPICGYAVERNGDCRIPKYDAEMSLLTPNLVIWREKVLFCSYWQHRHVQIHLTIVYSMNYTLGNNKTTKILASALSGENMKKMGKEKKVNKPKSIKGKY